MSHVALSVCVCLSVCLQGIPVSCTRTAEPIEMPFGGRGSDSRGSKEPCIRWGQDRTNPFAATRDDKSAMRRFATLLWSLVTNTTTTTTTIDFHIMYRRSKLICISDTARQFDITGTDGYLT